MVNEEVVAIISSAYRGLYSKLIEASTQRTGRRPQGAPVPQGSWVCSWVQPSWFVGLRGLAEAGTGGLEGASLWVVGQFQNRKHQGGRPLRLGRKYFY